MCTASTQIDKLLTQIMALDKTSSSVNTRTCLQMTLGRKCHLAPQADCDLFEILTAFTVYLLQVGKQCVLYIMSCSYGFHIYVKLYLFVKSYNIK